MVLAQFRQQYPQGSIVSELIDIDRGTYIVRVSVSVEQVILATGLAGAERVETAEDLARERAISALMLTNSRSNNTTVTPSALSSNSLNSHRSSVTIPPQPQPTTANPTPLPTPSVVASSNLDAIEESVVNGNYNSVPVEQPAKPIKSAISHNSPSPEDTINPPSSTTSRPTISVTELTSPPLPQPEATATAIVTSTETEPSQATGNLFEGTYNPELNLESNGQELATSSPAVADSEPSSATAVDLTDFDFMQIKQKTDLEIQRLGWTKEHGREFLKSHYGKRTRLHLTNEELLQFLQYLESQPTPS